MLFSRLSGYMSASLRKLKERHEAELLVFRWKPAREAPFDRSQFDWIDTLCDKDAFTRAEIVASLDRFQPDAILMAGWMDKDYLHVARHFKHRGVPVVAGCDTQWRGTWRQEVARRMARWYLHPSIDVLWVSGERQRQFANRLGFTGPRCWSGYYTCDWTLFAGTKAPEERQRQFLYTGRYVEAKGLDVLVKAYQQYRSQVTAPWPLVCVGAGPLEHMLRGEGIENRGFIQPHELPALMQDSGAFVLPSRWEPWGVVVHEAAAAGMPLICSDASGATVHLLQHGYNGLLFESENVEDLARCLVGMAEQQASERALMGSRSHELSKQYTPERWADTLVQGITRLQAG